MTVTVRPAEEWAPTFTEFFSDAEIVRITYALGVFRDGVYCKLCDAWITDSPTEHVEAHACDLAEWRENRRAVQTARLVELKQEVGGGPLPVEDLTLKQLKARIRNTQWKLDNPIRSGRKTWDDDQIAAMEKTIADAKRRLGLEA